jgi:hypothetical protein
MSLLAYVFEAVHRDWGPSTMLAVLYVFHYPPLYEA